MYNSEVLWIWLKNENKGLKFCISHGGELFRRIGTITLALFDKNLPECKDLHSYLDAELSLAG